MALLQWFQCSTTLIYLPLKPRLKLGCHAFAKSEMNLFLLLYMYHSLRMFHTQSDHMKIFMYKNLQTIRQCPKISVGHDIHRKYLKLLVFVHCNAYRKILTPKFFLCSIYFVHVGINVLNIWKQGSDKKHKKTTLQCTCVE